MTEPVTDASTEEPTTEGTTTMSDTTEEFDFDGEWQEAEQSSFVDELKELVKLGGTFTSKVKRIVKLSRVSFAVRKALLVRWIDEADVILDADYANPGGLARRSDGTVGVFAGNNASNNPSLQTLEAVADKVGVSVDNIVQSIARVLDQSIDVAQARARLLAADGIYKAAHDQQQGIDYRVRNDGQLKLWDEIARLAQELQQAQNTPAVAPVIQPLPHGFDGTLQAFENVPANRQQHVKAAVDEVINNHANCVANDGSLIGTSQTDYHAALNDIVANSQVETYYEGGPLHTRGDEVQVRVVHVDDMDENIVDWLSWQ